VTWPKLVTVATLLAEELQVTASVMFCVLPSLKVPVAASDNVEAGAITAELGETAMDFSVAELTVRSVCPDLPPNAAIMFALPSPTAVTTPTAPTVATAVLLDVQVTSWVMTCVLESLNVPVAVKANSVPGAMVRPAGETEIDTIVASLTVSVVEPGGAEPKVAVMVTGLEVGVRPLATPMELMGTAVVLDELHAT